MKISEVKKYIEQMMRVYGDIDVYIQSDNQDVMVGIEQACVFHFIEHPSEHYLGLIWGLPDDKKCPWLKVVKND